MEVFHFRGSMFRFYKNTKEFKIQKLRTLGNKARCGSVDIYLYRYTMCKSVKLIVAGFYKGRRNIFRKEQRIRESNVSENLFLDKFEFVFVKNEKKIKPIEGSSV